MFLFLKDSFISCYLVCVIVLIYIMFHLIGLLSITANYSTEKFSPYECGFIPFNDISGTLEPVFCIIAIVFLLFDIEILFLMPWVGLFGYTTKAGFFSMYLFYILITLGLAVEWECGTLLDIGG